MQFFLLIYEIEISQVITSFHHHIKTKNLTIYFNALFPEVNLFHFESISFHYIVTFSTSTLLCTSFHLFQMIVEKVILLMVNFIESYLMLSLFIVLQQFFFRSLSYLK